MDPVHAHMEHTNTGIKLCGAKWRDLPIPAELIYETVKDKTYT